MLVRNYAKPFCIAGFVLAEIYILLVVLAPNFAHDTGRALLAPMPLETTVAAGTPPPLGYLIGRIVVAVIFSGPLGALVGLGIGLVFSALVQAVQRKSP
jgi:hypothetical protein